MLQACNIFSGNSSVYRRINGCCSMLYKVVVHLRGRVWGIRYPIFYPELGFRDPPSHCLSYATQK
jgi:hypothetical protein